MNTIPTAEEFLSDHINRVVFPWIDNWVEDNNQEVQTILECMIEFAKLHVQAALENAYNQSYIVKVKPVEPYSYADESNFGVDKNSILNSYPLTNIK